MSASWAWANAARAGDHAPRAGLIGFDPLDTAACWAACVPEARVVQNTDDSSVLKLFGGIEMALWDLRGNSGGSRSTSCRRRCASRSVHRILRVPREGGAGG